MKINREIIVNKAKKWFKSQDKRGILLGVTDSFRSTLTAKIWTEAIGAENIVALMFSDRSIYNSESHGYKINLCNQLGIRVFEKDMYQVFLSFDSPLFTKEIRKGIAPKIRRILFESYSESMNLAIASTIGYSEINILNGVNDCDLISLAEEYNLPEKLINLFKSKSIENNNGVEPNIIENLKDMPEKNTISISESIVEIKQDNVQENIQDNTQEQEQSANNEIEEQPVVKATPKKKSTGRPKSVK